MHTMCIGKSSTHEPFARMQFKLAWIIFGTRIYNIALINDPTPGGHNFI